MITTTPQKAQQQSSHVVGIEEVELFYKLVSSLRGDRAQLHHLGLSPVPHYEPSRQVRSRALDGLHGKLGLLVEDVVQHVEVHGSPQVVHVADEDVLLTLMGDGWTKTHEEKKNVHATVICTV